MFIKACIPHPTIPFFGASPDGICDPESENKQINSYLDNCLLRTMKINFGRFELEEFLIRKHKPLLNRKENK